MKIHPESEWRNPTHRPRHLLFTAILWLAWSLCLPAPSAQYVSFCSTNPPDAWNSMDSWSPNGIPGAGDEAAVGCWISVGADQACALLHLNSRLDVWSGQSLTIGGGDSAGGMLANSGTLMNQGVFASTGLTLNPGFTWQNQGTFQQTAGSVLVNGTFLNQTNANFLLTADNLSVSGSGAIRNYGTLTKTAGAGASSISPASFQNLGGTVAVQSGTLQTPNGASSTNGLWEISAGAVWDLTSAGNVTYSGEFTGSGSGHAAFSGGTMVGSPVFNLAGGLYWQAGVLRDFMENRGLLVLEGSARKDYWFNIVNKGTLRHAGGGDLYIHGNPHTAAFYNEPGALFDLTADGTNVTGQGIYSQFYNRGTIRKSAGTGASVIETTLNNLDARIEVLTGSLVLRGDGSSSNCVIEVATGAALDLTGGSNPKYGGALSGSGGGRVGWSGGRIGPSEPLVLNFPNGLFWGGGGFWGYVRNDGLMLLEGDAQKENFISALDNNGTIRQTNGGALYLNKFNNTCYLLNQAGALYEIQSDGTNITGSYPDNVDDAIHNYGLFRKTAGDGVSRITAAFCNNGGTVEVQHGSLVLAGGGVSSNGVFNVATGASLDLTGGAEPRYFGTFTGTGGGRIGWSSGSFGRWSSVTLDFTNGVYWGGGQFNGYIRNNALLLIEGSAQKENFISTLDNYGTIRHSGSGSLYLNEFVNQCSLNNQAGAVYELQSDGNNITGGGGNTYFRNFGTLRKSAGPGTSVIQSPFYNYAGMVEALAGTLQFSAYTHSNAVIRLNGGNVSFPAFTLNGGILQGAGTVTVAGTLTSSGAVSPGLSAGTLNLQGNFTQAAGGSLNIELGGRSNGQFDEVKITGNASLNGALNVTVLPSFQPAPGDQFLILSCANRTGVFSVTNVPPGLMVSYTDDGVLLIATNAFGPTLVSPEVEGTNFCFWIQTATNLSYSIEYNDDLRTTNWLFHHAIIGDDSLRPCLLPMTNTGQRFFRVRQP